MGPQRSGMGDGSHGHHRVGVLAGPWLGNDRVEYGECFTAFAREEQNCGQLDSGGDQIAGRHLRIAVLERE